MSTKSYCHGAFIGVPNPRPSAVSRIAFCFSTLVADCCCEYISAAASNNVLIWFYERLAQISGNAAYLLEWPCDLQWNSCPSGLTSQLNDLLDYSGVSGDPGTSSGSGTTPPILISTILIAVFVFFLF